MALKAKDKKQFNITADERVINRLKNYCNVERLKICAVFEKAITQYLNASEKSPAGFQARPTDPIISSASEFAAAIKKGKND